MQKKIRTIIYILQRFYEVMFRLFSFFVFVVSLGVAVAQEPSDNFIEKGCNALNKGLFDRAEYYFRQAYPNDTNAAFPLGELLIRCERFSEAVEVLTSCHSADCYTLRAQALAAVEQWDSAATIAAIAIEMGATGSPMATLALCERAAGHHTNAYTWAKRAVDAAPNDARCWTVMGCVAFSKGSDAEALRHFRKALQLDSNSVDACYNLGVMYTLRNNLDNASHTLRSGLRRHPKSLRLYQALGRVYRLRSDPKRATQCYEAILSIDSVNLNAWLSLGEICRERGEYERAQSYYQKCIRIDATYTAAHKALGLNYTQWGDFTKAIRAYQKAVQVDANDADTYLLIAQLYNKQGNIQREQNAYKKAARLGSRPAQQWLIGRGLTW